MGVHADVLPLLVEGGADKIYIERDRPYMVTRLPGQSLLRFQLAPSFP